MLLQTLTGDTKFLLHRVDLDSDSDNFGNELSCSEFSPSSFFIDFQGHNSVMALQNKITK